MESIEVNPRPTLNAITTKPLPRIVNTIDVYVNEEMLDLNTPRDELETIVMHSKGEEKRKLLLLNFLPIFALQYPYMIGLLSQ